MRSRSWWRRFGRRYERTAQLRAQPARLAGPAPPRGRCPRGAGRTCAAGPPQAAADTRSASHQRAGADAPLQPLGLAQLLDQRELLPAWQLHHEIQPGRQRGGGPAARLCLPAPLPGPGHGTGRPGADAPPGGRALHRGRRRPGHPAAGGRRARRVDGAADDPGLPPGPRRASRPGPGAGQRPRHQPGQRRALWLPGGGGQVGRRRAHQRGRPGVQAQPARGGAHAHQPQHARPVRARDPGGGGDGPCHRRQALLRRRQPQRPDGHLPPRRHGLRRRAHEPAQDLHHAARRGWAGRRPGRRQE